MVLPKRVPLKILRGASNQSTKIRSESTIPLPGSLEKYGKPSRVIRLNDSEKPQKNQSNEPGKNESPSRRPEINDAEGVRTKPEGQVEGYLDTHVPEKYGFSINPSMKDANLCFKKIPAHVTRVKIDPGAIYKIWPTVDKLLPRDPLHSGDARIGIRGIQDLYSWAPSGSKGRGRKSLNALHLGWTLPIFPTTIDPASLLFDGTDNRFLPGPPEVWPYRLWSSGSIRYFVDVPPQLYHALHTHHILEKPVDVQVVGETVRVTVRKSIMSYMGRKLGGLYTGPNMLKLVDSEPTDDFNDYNGPYAVEEYNLVFFKKPPKSLSKDNEKSFRPPKDEAQYSHTLRFNRHDLFVWSGITQNAHLIHLDTNFAKTEYGAKDLVVQGSFTVFLILEWLRRSITAKAVNRLDKFQIFSIEYRVLAPIFVDDLVRFCARPIIRAVPGSVSTYWHIWIEKVNPKDPESSGMTFTAKIKIRPEPWESAVAPEGREDEVPESSETDFDEEAAQELSTNDENHPVRDDLESEGFSSPFFNR